MQWSGGAPYVHEYNRGPVIGVHDEKAKARRVKRYGITEFLPASTYTCKCKSGKHDCDAAKEDNWYLQVIKDDPIKTRGGNNATPPF